MSHSIRPTKKVFLTVYILTWCILLVAAGWGLTVFLVGTLGDPLPAQAEARPGAELMDRVVALTERKVDRFLGDWEFSEPELPGHFHHVGRWYQTDTTNFCIDCHGAIPHSRSPKIRAFLNMHNLFIGCQVCHVREHEGGTVSQFGWIDTSTGKTTPPPEMFPGVWGEYGAKIFPMDGTLEDPQPLHLIDEEALAEEIRKNKKPLNDSQKVKANKFIHRRCSEDPVGCLDCHNTQKVYLPYTDLGYRQERADFLVSAEVADLVARYEVFHMPNLLNTDSDPNVAPAESTLP